MEQNNLDRGRQAAAVLRGAGSTQNLGRGGGAFIFKLNMDVALIIFSILLKFNFTDFASFFITWAYSHPQAEIDFILRNLDWSKMRARHEDWHPGYITVNRWDRSAYTKFFGFLGYCKRRGIDQAIFYDSCSHLLKREETENNLATLQQLSINHSPSVLGFYVFRSLYEPLSVEQCATAIHNHLKTLHYKQDLRWVVKVLGNIYKSETTGNTERYTPNVGGICPWGKLRSSNHFFIHSCYSTFEEVLSSTCPLYMLFANDLVHDI